MIPIIAFVGEKGSGKTTLLERVIDLLVERGRKVGVIKHTTHSFTLDYKETDTNRLYQAGSKFIAISSREKIGFYGDVENELLPEEIRDLFFPRLDVILTEGYKSSHLPKILVALNGNIPEWADGLGGLIAVVCPHKPNLNAKHFLPEQINELVGLIEDYCQRLSGKREVKIYLDSRSLQIKPFIKDLFLNTILAMVSSLKDVEGAKRIQISIDLPEGIHQLTKSKS